MWNLSGETTWKKEQGLWELTSIFTCSNNGTDGDIFTNIWLFPAPPHAHTQSLSTDMSGACVQRKFQPSQLSKHLLPSGSKFYLHSNFSFFQETECLWQREDKLKAVKQPPASMAAFLLGWSLTASQLLLFLVLFLQWFRRTTMPVVQVQWNLWTTIKCHNQRFIKFLNQKF